jgi:bifunctional NMN adenylyltransferase/nudix hydrolase
MAPNTSASPAHDLAVFIGRFQPFHNGHLHVILQALLFARYVLIVIGSHDMARRPDHLPFTSDERRDMILAGIPAEFHDRIRFAYAEDFGNMTMWTSNVRRMAEVVLAETAFPKDVNDCSVTLIGHKKDNSSFYLSAFQDWETIDVANHENLSATPMREKYLNADEGEVAEFFRDAAMMMPKGTVDWLKAFMVSRYYREMVAEWQFMKDYLRPYLALPYPPKFVTVDNVVIFGDKVLLVLRKGYPCKGLWALPGGHLNDDENVITGCLRELKEETKLKVPEAILRGSIIGEPKVYDNPYRSMRKRTITHAVLVHIVPKIPTRQDGTLETDPDKIRAALAPPKIKASDDAKKAQWVPLHEIKRSELMEDHWQIIQEMRQRIPADK